VCCHCGEHSLSLTEDALAHGPHRPLYRDGTPA
jgi:hypothetical protein